MKVRAAPSARARSFYYVFPASYTPTNISENYSAKPVICYLLSNLHHMIAHLRARRQRGGGEKEKPPHATMTRNPASTPIPTGNVERSTPASNTWHCTYYEYIPAPDPPPPIVAIPWKARVMTQLLLLFRSAQRRPAVWPGYRYVYVCPPRSRGGLARLYPVPFPGWIPLPRPSWAIPHSAQLASCPRGGARPSTARLQHNCYSSPLCCASNPQGVPSGLLHARTPANTTTFRRAVGDRNGVPIDCPPLPTQNATRGRR